MIVHVTVTPATPSPVDRSDTRTTKGAGRVCPTTAVCEAPERTSRLYWAGWVAPLEQPVRIPSRAVPARNPVRGRLGMTAIISLILRTAGRWSPHAAGGVGTTMKTRAGAVVGAGAGVIAPVGIGGGRSRC